jgi:hypothetical protein
VGLATVTLSTTASASAGTPPRPAIGTSRAPPAPAPHGEAYGPTLLAGRESRTRAGTTGW